MMAFNKGKAISYIRGEISVLGEQSDEVEIRAGVNRIRGALGVLISTDLITTEEGASLEDEMAVARTAAASRLEK